jgi:hypothetical protein
MKKNKKALAGVLSVLMVIAFLSCGDSGGGGSTPTPTPGEKPVDVDMNLPSIGTIAVFPGNDVNDKDDVQELLQSVFDTIFNSGINGLNFNRVSSRKIQPVLRSIARSVQKDSILENFKNEEILDNVFATGYVQGNFTASAKDDNYYLELKGDYLEAALNSKIALDFKVADDDLFMAGKATFGGDVNFKYTVTGDEKAAITGNLMFENKYMLSVSNKIIGMKLDMKIIVPRKSASLNIDYNNDDTLFNDIEKLLKNSFTITIDVYNKEGQIQPTLCKTLKSVEDILEYLGIDYSDIFNF